MAGVSTFGALPELPVGPDQPRYVTVRTAAKRLGVDREVVEGLVCAKKLRGYRTQGATGQEICVVDLDDLRRVQTLTADSRG